jgi:hypothetical protein
MAKLSQAEGLLDEYERSLDEVGLQSFGPLARASGFVRNISSMLGFDPHVKNYNAFRRGTVSPLARALGESGALAEGDVARAIELIPSIGETQYEADLKLNSLRSLLNRAKGSVAGYGGFDELGTGGQMTPPQQAYY